ncbi:MAG: TonB-dependent receptor [Campylobacter sp.]|nr:TonB-dependent receptor [Campylobacter sp.]
MDNVNTQKADGYFTTDLGARYISKNMLGKRTTLRFNVNNVFDEEC